MRTYPIHIAFCVNDAYAKYISVTIKSIVDNHPEDMVTIHILSDYISEKSRIRLSEAIVGAESHIELIYHTMDDTKFEGLRVKSKWPTCTWYRMVLCNVLPEEIHRVLYLDADTVVAANLVHLFQLDMQDKSIAAVPDIYSIFGEQRATNLGYDESKGYVCSGVVLFNLDYWRQHALAEKSLDWARIHAGILAYPDQDVLNVICQDTKIMLPLNYAVASYYFYYDLFYRTYMSEVKACVEHPVIMHFIAKTWHKETSQEHPFYKVWRHYNRCLKQPVPIVYESKGLIRLKVQIWNLLHPFYKNPRQVSIPEIKQRIRSYERSVQ
jgi:lipopolysaccharide biosynthesis glycosyltransferase